MECQAVENGRQAIQAVQAERFDLVLMDCQMPEMDGFEATRRIREWNAAAQLSGHVPVIALTANAIKGDHERAWKPAWTTISASPSRPACSYE